MSEAQSWEPIYTRPYDVLERLQVEGGWLYRNRVARKGPGEQLVWEAALAFVPEHHARRHTTAHEQR